jgi:hypothetical protein
MRLPRSTLQSWTCYRAALADAQQLADKLDCRARCARCPKDFEPNAIELADRLLSGVALQDNLSKRITETARKIETLRRAIELQQREVLRIRGEHSRRVCRDAWASMLHGQARVVLAVEETVRSEQGMNRNCAPLSRPRATAARCLPGNGLSAAWRGLLRHPRC